MTWIGPQKAPVTFRRGEPIQLAVSSPICYFRQAAIDALNGAGIPWQIGFSSLSVHGVWAAVEAGLGITLRTATSVPKQLAVIKSRSGLPRLGKADLFLHDGGRDPSKPISRFKETLLESLQEHLKPGRTGGCDTVNGRKGDGE